ncbi:MAG: sulfur carrier protein ThiS [Lysobacteraceae bacterium]
MELTINGQVRQFDAMPTVSELLDLLGLAERRLAVEVNGRIVPRSRHAEERLAAGDVVELVQAIGGG